VALAAKKVGLSPASYAAREATGEITPRQLERLADAVKRPVIAFFLPERPQEPQSPTDFRAAGRAKSLELSPAVRYAIRRARRIVRIYDELGGEPWRHPLKLTRDEPAPVGAARVRRALGVSPEEQASWGSAAAALEEWRSRLEQYGVLVLQFSLRDEGISGFSVTDGRPAIVLNKNDHESRRCFTLFHEWAHVLLEEPGLCNVDEGRMAMRSEGIEAFCNAFAAELLVPLPALRDAGIPAAVRDRQMGVAEGIEEVRTRFGVSRWVALIRLLTAQVISRAAFERMSRRWNAEDPAPARRGGRSRPHRQALQNLGAPYVGRVLAARDSGELTDADVVDYLNLKRRWFDDLEAMMPAR
jgi:Zn-dependent peptidase ImmA (M78 family)